MLFVSIQCGLVIFCCFFAKEFCLQAHDVLGDDKIEEVSNETALLEGVSNVDKSGRWARVTFKIVLSYHGGSFDGWQKQPGLNTVQG